MKNHLFGSVAFVLLFGTVIAILLSGATAKPDSPQLTEWQLVPDNALSEAGYRLVPSNGACDVNMPNGTHVTVPQNCNVFLADCAVAVGQSLKPECDTLRIDATVVAIGQDAPVRAASSWATSSGPTPVNCSGPAHIVHAIEQGDTLWGLSVKYHLTLNDLLAFNRLSVNQAEHLALGYPICIPTSQ